MTEMVNGMSQSSDTASSQPSPSNVAPAVTQSVMQDERTFRQSEVNDIVKRAKHDALESYKRMQTEQPQYAAQKFGDQPATHTAPSAQHSASLPPSHGFNEESLRRIASEEAQRHLDQLRQDALQKNQDEMAKRTVQNFYSKVSKGREKYQDFDAVTGDVELARFPNVVQLLGEFIDNSDDVMYDLAKDRIKLANLEQLANMSPKDAVTQVRRLADSLKLNQDAKNVRVPNEPLSQLRPSNQGTDNGVMSVKDYRAKYKV